MSFLRNAKRLLKEQKYEELVEFADENISEDEFAAQLMKAHGLLELERLPEAETALKAARVKDPLNINVLKGLMKVYLKQKRLEEHFAVGRTCLYAYVTDERYKALPDVENQFKAIYQRIVPVMIRQASANSNNSQDLLLLALSLQVPYDCAPFLQLKNEDPKIHDVVHQHVIDYGLLNQVSHERLMKVAQRLLKQKISAVSSRQKQTVGFTPLRAAEDKLQVLKTSKMPALLRYLINIEKSDNERREQESALLALLCDEAEWLVVCKKKVNSAEIRDLSERMAMFAPTTPQCYELQWDFEMPDMAQIKAELQNESKKERNKRNKKNSKKKGKHDSSEEAKEGEDNEDIGEAVEDEDETKYSEAVSPSSYEAIERFMALFPNEQLTNVLKQYLQNGDRRKLADYSKLQCVFGLLLASELLCSRQKYLPAIDAVHNAQKLVAHRSKLYGMDFREARVRLSLVLAQSYTHLDAPKNFALAEEHFDEVIALAQDSMPAAVAEARVGKGLILSQQGRTVEAMQYFERVLELDESNALAKRELAWLRGLSGDVSEAVSSLMGSLSVGDAPAVAAQTHWRIGKLLWDSNERTQQCFDEFVAALNCAQNFAPAYTSLGLFYEDVLMDQQRAQRCFYKALELDSAQLEAGERLAADFAAHAQWDLVECVAANALEAISAGSVAKAAVWPYRALGIVCINQQRYADAVKYFQHCLRLTKKDPKAWVGLGESYIHSGRFRSAEKALGVALRLAPNDFSAHYVLAQAHRHALNFPQSVKELLIAIELGGESPQLLYALAETRLEAAHFHFGQSELQEARTLALDAIKALAETTSLFETNKAFESGVYALAAECILSLGEMGVAEKSLKLPSLFESAVKCVQHAVKAAEEQRARPVKVAAHAMAARAYSRDGNNKQAIEHYKEAIVLEPKNAELWTGYGCVLLQVSPRASQHCLIRALSLDGRNASIWLNLAVLYLCNGDPELALEACDRALSIEPDMARGWVVSALAQKVLESRSSMEIYRTLEHAYLLSLNDSPVSMALAAMEFETRVANPSTASLGALDKVLQVNPENKHALLVLGLLLERRQDYFEAERRLVACKQYVHAARAQLAQGKHSQALQSASLVLENASTSGYNRLSALLVSALANFFTGNVDESIAFFTTALEEFETDAEVGEEVLKLLVQVLYAAKTEETFAIAQEQLFLSIEARGATLEVTLLLGALGLLLGDDAVKEAAREELRVLISPMLSPEDLARASHMLHLLDPEDNTYLRAVFMCPTEYALWRGADKQQALIVAQSGSDFRQLAQALREAGGTRNCQRAAFIDPVSQISLE